MELAAVITGLAFLAVVAWLAELRWHPYGQCWRCGGSGWNRGSTRKRYGYCPRCKNKRQRIRVGATLVRPELKQQKAKNKRKKKGK